MKIIGVFEVLCSKPDINGNRYWAFVFTDTRTGFSIDGQGVSHLSNIEAAALRIAGDGEKVMVIKTDLPIRDFNRVTRMMPYTKDVTQTVKSALDTWRNA